MKLPKDVQEDLIHSLRAVDPEKVIVFGSYAYGEPGINSDIDLYVVTKDKFLPSNWKESGQVYLKVVNALDDLSKRYQLDVIAHTLPMHERFLHIDSMFSRKIMNQGFRLL